VIRALDHVVLAAADLERAARNYETLLGRPPVWSGEGSPRRARFGLANMALVLSAADGGEAGFVGLGFGSADPAETLRMLERRGLGPGGGDGVAITVTPIADPEPEAVRDDLVEALDHVVILSPNPDRAVALYGARLGLDFRLDRANPQWGTRLMFFRCGGAVLEVSADLKAPVSDGPDRITGLAWRVRNPRAAQRRLAAAGLDVSQVRPGRKPGTAVFTLRSGLEGAPALLIGPAG
jgi:catechol 2,3-dioxygenase-like lactoylglutathione lyase family enzyme